MRGIIELTEINKSFKVYHDKGQSLKEKLLFRERNYYENREVLKNISLTINQGESVGLIGDNGCGKSTLLKLINQILYPDSGNVKTTGRISSLIELGAGFHSDMSGRENIYTNASIFGLTKKDIDQKLEGIIRFSELEEFIDNPVRTYSSGMYMRLAFSVAINVGADILLIDEILAVGDSSFQQKCFKKLTEIKEQGVTIVMVSHDHDSIKRICERCIWLHDGKIIDDNYSYHTIFRYSKYVENKIAQRESKELLETEKARAGPEAAPDKSTENKSSTIKSDLLNWGNKRITFREIYLKNESGEVSDSFQAGETLTVEFLLSSKEVIDRTNIGVGISSDDGRMIYGINTDMDNITLPPLGDNAVVRFIITTEGLNSGEYKIHASITNGAEEVFDWYPTIKTFQVKTEKNFVGIRYTEHSWNVVEH